MAKSPALKVHEVCSVAPPQGTTTPTTLPLTFFDLLWLRLPPVERLFFYELPNPTPITSLFHSVLPKLKHSLEITLQHFFPLAGNITFPLDSPTPIITYVPGEDSVPFTVAESTEDFTHLCSNLCDVSKRHLLVPRLKNMSDDKASVLALQVTLFPNGGFCVGITTHHAAVDGKCSTLFMKAWAYTCSKLLGGESSPSLPENLTPSLDRSVIRDPKGITEAYLNGWLNFGGEKNNRSLKVFETLHDAQTDAVKGVFELTPSQIQKLKKYAQSKVKVSKVSTFAVTCAYLLSCLVKAEKPESDKIAFIFSVDCRSRLDPPVVANYFGDCIMGRLFLGEKKKLMESDGFIDALVGISDQLNGLDSGVLNGAENWMSNMGSVGQGNRFYSVAGSPRFEVYGIDFGWGRPKKVDVTSVDRTGAFSLSESRDIDGGVEIGLALNKGHMEAFATLFHQELESFQGC